MSYHLLVGVLAEGWSEYPQVADNHRLTEAWKRAGACLPTAKHPGSTKFNSTLQRDICLEHFFHRGTLLSFLWLDFAEEIQLAPLLLYGQGNRLSTPDGIILRRQAKQQPSACSDAASSAARASHSLDNQRKAGGAAVKTPRAAAASTTPGLRWLAGDATYRSCLNSKLCGPLLHHFTRALM